jgi:hypothetical protein
VEGLRRFAAERGLEFQPTGHLEGPWSVLRWGERRRFDGFARGPLADGRGAVLAGCVCTARDAEGAPLEFQLLLAASEVPEAPPDLGWLEVRSLEARAFGQLPPGADFNPGAARELPLESEFFAQRFKIAAGPGTDQNAVVQLFSPAFLHWYAYEGPYAMSLELLGGRLCLHAPADLRSHDRARSLWDACERISSELAREGRERSGAA